MKSEKWMLVQDDDGHWYVIPRDREADWDAWMAAPEPDLDLPEDQIDYTAWNAPDWAEAVGGAPSLVTFLPDGSYRIG